MKKTRMLFCALVLVLLSASAVSAENRVKHQDPQLQEIILDKNFEIPTSDGLLVSDNNEQQANFIQSGTSKEVTLEDKVKKDETEAKKHFFQIFDLKGGVEKSNADEQKQASVEQTKVQEWLNGSYATGKWFGARPVLEDHGLTINSSLLFSPFMKTGGGANGEGSGKGYSLFNLSATLDTEKAGLWKGGTFYTLYQRKAGYGLSGPNGNNGAMGDWMGFDGWDWHQINQISELWYQQKLMDGKVRLKFGKQDANVDFCFLNSGWDFMNTAFSVNPTVPLPTYPDQAAVGFVAEFNPKEWLSIRNGIYSRYNTPFNITEVEARTKIKNMPGRYLAGAWEISDSSGLGVGAGLNDDGTTYYNNFNRNYGAYFAFEQMVYKEKKNDDNDMQGLVVFGQAGASPDNKNDMSKYVAGGLHYKGLLKNRDNDLTGIAVASGFFAPRLGDVGADYGNRIGSETVLEAFYRVQISPWFYLQPDVQFIMNPGGMYDNSVAVGLRSVITF